MYKSVYNYLENQVLNASPIEHIIMLYNKAIACLNTSWMAIENGLDNPENLKKKVENITRATEILAYLQGILNLEKGGEIAKNFNEIYKILINELIKANIENDPEIIAKSIEILKSLKKAWEDIKKENGKR
ncbi:flagellar export chaperone FliS [Candidatus Pacearchaeota archaeon]|nr:MAG: flagellar export chaperone FliS [Candidatus Pacearchaeota archaeon]